MAAPAIAQLIAKQLGAGLPHPGKPETNEAPRLIPLAGFRTAGMAPEMRQHVENSAQCVGEAIVHLIEAPAPIGADHVVIPRAELNQLRAADDLPGMPLPVVCKLCGQPIVHLQIVNGRARVNPALLDAINTTCPHNTEATP